MASTFVFFEIYKNQVTLVNIIFNVEVKTRKKWDQWDNIGKKQTIQEDRQSVALVITKIKLFRIFVLCLVVRVFLLMLMELLTNPIRHFMRAIEQRVGICDES